MFWLVYYGEYQILGVCIFYFLKVTFPLDNCQYYLKKENTTIPDFL